MKKVTPYFAMFVWVIATFISGCRHSEPSGVIVKDALGFYHINGKPESLDLKMADGVIVFSRKNGFHIGTASPGKDFYWSDNKENFHLSYQGTLCFDFNKDFIFDFFLKRENISLFSVTNTSK